MNIVLELPYPPTVNHYYATFKNRRLLSKKGREYHQEIGAIVLSHRANERLSKRLSVIIQAWMPDKRKRDIDNIVKPLLDALGKAGVYEDDSQIDSLNVSRMGIEKGGKCVVHVKEVSGDWPRDNVS